MKKLNWGWGIFFVCTAFILFISALVYRASKEKIEFVTDNYYDKELKFQEQINHMQNASELPENIRVMADQPRGAISISYPASIDWKSVSGQITFFKPDNSGLDFVVRASSDENHAQQVPMKDMKKGWWEVKINWAAGNTPYYFEQKLYVN